MVGDCVHDESVEKPSYHCATCAMLALAAEAQGFDLCDGDKIGWHAPKDVVNRPT